ncbi:unnamed protein product [Lactuca saligna]|uniref:Uncharacterized protein n=1 Tax=Lactuca saligna TaxID=75948 RepID=A0AA35ZWV6_LACSI|nr:unnamed protein product [Lactuca saligna]
MLSSYNVLDLATGTGVVVSLGCRFISGDVTFRRAYGSYVMCQRFSQTPPFFFLLLFKRFSLSFLTLPFYPLSFWSLFSVVAIAQGSTPSSSEFVTLQEAYGLTPDDGVEFPVSGSLITHPPLGKMLTPGTIHKVVAFEMIWRANGIIPNYFVFKYFFRFAVTNDKYTFSARPGGDNLVMDSNPPKNR